MKFNPRFIFRTISTMCNHPKPRSFLFWFSNEHTGFRISELEALFKLFKLENHILQQRKVIGPFIIMDFPNEEPAKKLMSRSVLAHSCFEIWGSAESLAELQIDVAKNNYVATPYFQDSFEIRVDTFGKSLRHSEKLEFIESLDYIPLEGKVDLRNPVLSLHLILFYGLDSNNVPENPYHVFLGRWITDGQRDLMSKISLKTRKFIGNTSMDPLLSLVMANMALVADDDLVLDPFVGTGSLLIAAAMMGGMVCGTDIDYLMLHGKTRPTRANQKSRAEDESVLANFEQYDVRSRYLDVLVGDASLPLWRRDIKFDAIITDPPYGVREPTERIGSLKSYKIKEEHLERHYPSKIDYSLREIFSDLIDFGAEQLKMGGRMVFWLPIMRTTYSDEQIPQNPSFQLVANCEQSLTTYAARRLIVFEKIAEPIERRQTFMHITTLVERFKLCTDVTDKKSKRERKSIANSFNGIGGKRGQLQP